MFQSPLKTVAEKIKPVESKSSVSSLKFDRASDFKKFINFIKNETKELEKIKLPTTAEVEPKSKRGGALGLLGLGLFGLLGSAMGGGEKDDKFRIGGTQASGIPTVPQLGLSTLRKTPLKITNKTIKTVLSKKRQNVINRRRDRDKARKERRERRINNKINENNKKFINEFQKRKKRTLNNARVKLGIPLDDARFTDFDVEQILNQDRGLFPGELDQKIADKITKEFEKKGIRFQDALDPKTRSKVYQDIKIDELLNKIETPMTLQDIELLQKLATEKDVPLGAKSNFFTNLFKNVKPTQDAIEAQQILDSPSVKRVIKESKFQGISGINTPKASKIFGFTPKYALDDIFTGIGEKTKGFRQFMSRPFMKGQKPTGVGKALMPAAKFGGNILRFGGAGLDAAAFVFQAKDLIDGFIVGDNILTAYYDLGVAFHNMFETDKEKLAFYITKSRDPRKNALVDKKNQKILEQINKAKEVQNNTSNQVSSAPQGGVIPFAKGMVSTAFSELTLSPPIYSLRLITEKLYKQ